MSRRQSGSAYVGEIAGLYDLEETIGRGHFAVVKLARHVFTGEKVAVKVIDKQKLDEISKAHLFQEVRCMKLVQHPNVVRLYEVIDTQTKLYLIQELGDGGDMYDYIMRHERGLDELSARTYFKQIVQAISYCHELHVVHRDLKPENVIFFEKLGLVKLTDFGFSNQFNPGKKLETSCGSLAYSAPEILLGDSYDAPAVDVWSLGVLLFMLVCGEAPFQEANDSETLTMIMDCKYKLPPHITQECRNLIGNMLKREPGHRASLKQIMKDPWLNMGDGIPAITMPLISREVISEEDHLSVIERMEEGNIATREEILRSLEKDSYDHITATYYLLVERKLKRQHMQLAQSQQAGETSLRRVASAGAGMAGKPNLEPLALSPRVQIGHVTQAEMFRNSTVESLVSPLAHNPPGNFPTNLDTDETPGRLRKFSLIKEESMEEESETESNTSKNEKMDAEESVSRERKVSFGEDDSDGSDSRSGSESNLSLRTLYLRRPVTSRPSLRTVSSSPQLLNQIFEEGESEEDDDLVPIKAPARVLRARNSIASPEVMRKLRQRKKRQGGASCSSSDASDTDDPDTKKRKEKLKHRFHRKDSSDNSSDTDGPSGFGGAGPGGRGPSMGGNSKDKSSGGDKDKGGDKNSSGKKKQGKSGNGGGKHASIGITLSEIKEQGNTSDNKDASSKSNSSTGNHIRKHSNLSISSNLSNLSLSSLTSRSSKYLVDSNNTTPLSTNRDSGIVETENKVNARIIHVISREFSDICEKFSRENSLKEESVSVCSADCTINQSRPNSKRRSRDKIKVDINSNGLEPSSPVPNPQEGATIIRDPVTTRCCNVL